MDTRVDTVLFLGWEHRPGVAAWGGDSARDSTSLDAYDSHQEEWSLGLRKSRDPRTETEEPEFQEHLQQRQSRGWRGEGPEGQDAEEGKTKGAVGRPGQGGVNNLAEAPEEAALAGVKPDCRAEKSSKVSDGNASEGDFCPEPRPRMGRRRKTGSGEKIRSEEVFCLSFLPAPPASPWGGESWCVLGRGQGRRSR